MSRACPGVLLAVPLTASARPRRLARAVLAVAMLGLATPGLTGCSGAVLTEPAQLATDPACAQVLVDLRGAERIDGWERRDVSAQSTAAWGDGDVILRCGVAPLGPSTDPCQTIGGVDWVIRQSEDRTMFLSYGRAPAVEVSLRGDRPTNAAEVLDAVSPAVATLPSTGRSCI